MERYVDLKHAAEQIDFHSDILSRFDCIFIVRDIRDEERDSKIANHIVSLHSGAAYYDVEKVEIDLELLKNTSHMLKLNAHQDFLQKQVLYSKISM